MEDTENKSEAGRRTPWLIESLKEKTTTEKNEIPSGGRRQEVQKPYKDNKQQGERQFKPRMYEAPWPMQVWSLVLRAANNLRPARP